MIGAERERAVTEAARSIGVAVRDFAVGSLCSSSAGERGGLLYIVEFSQSGMEAERIAAFASHLVDVLLAINEDYPAQRSEDRGMKLPVIEILPPGWNVGRNSVASTRFRG